jgi:CubicO group peptidase (beta-lactamase class C family)
MSNRASWTVYAVLALTLTACGLVGEVATTKTDGIASASATVQAAVSSIRSTAAGVSAGSTIEVRNHTYALGDFPAFPGVSLSDSTAAALQAILNSAVESGTFVGVTAAVIVSDLGSWTGAAGSWDDIPLTVDSRHPTHSSAKTFVAAQILRLVEDGKLSLEDLASDHLPPELGFYDANGASIRQLLSMRSGVPGLNEKAGYYPAQQARSVEEVFQRRPYPTVSPGVVTNYASTNFVLLGTIIENVTGQALSDALRTDVLAHPGLEGIVHNVENALGSDGLGGGNHLGVTGAMGLGYALYGGLVLSDTSLGEMTDFQGEWYGLGVMDFSNEYGEFAVGHQGLSSVTTCCSAIILLVLPEQGTVIAVQANTAETAAGVDTNRQVDQLAALLMKGVRR